MIIFLATRHHTYTVTNLLPGRMEDGGPVCHVIPYDDLFTLDGLPAATYIFTDIERLAPWERRLAAEYHRQLLAAGRRCLNDPARVLTRYPLLAALHAKGLNPFRAWRLEEGLPPARLPVFLRAEGEHGPPLSDIIATPEALRAAIDALQAEGQPLAGMLAVEFCGEPIAPGAWAKHGTFRIGPRLQTVHLVVEDSWCVKYGTKDFATDAMFEAQAVAVADNRFAATIAPAFEVGAIEWGRADHGTVGGREVVYEINTNPNLPAPTLTHRSPVHLATLALARRRLIEALGEIDGESGPALRIEPSDWLSEYRRRSLAIRGFQP